MNKLYDIALAGRWQKRKDLIYNWSWIQLRAGLYDKWLSCPGEGKETTCKYQSCPGKGGGVSYKGPRDRCRAEWFQITNKKSHNLKVCDLVGIRYSYWSSKNKGYWLSHHKGRKATTKTCPGRNYSNLDHPKHFCGSERWRILVAGKKCGQDIEHLDVVNLKVPHVYSFLKHRLDSGSDKTSFGSKACIEIPVSRPHSKCAASFIIFKNGLKNYYNW